MASWTSPDFGLYCILRRKVESDLGSILDGHGVVVDELRILSKTVWSSERTRLEKKQSCMIDHRILHGIYTEYIILGTYPCFLYSDVRHVFCMWLLTNTS